MLLAALLALATPVADPQEIRAIWVTRFEYQTESDVKTIVANCAALGFNTILFQVRGQADAYYASSIEPWADRLGGRDPGFDPLETACREAKRRGVELHAWINSMTAWRGAVPPTNRRHVCFTHPEWIVVDKRGRRQPFNDHYVALNPCLPEVQDYVASVARDIAERYPIDGLHLDYIRFIEGDWSHDARTLGIFKRQSGSTPDRDAAGWATFRRDAVTESLRKVRGAVKSARPEAKVTAAVFPTAASRERVLQDAEAWTRRGLVDAVFPMTYDDSDGDFREQIEEGYELLRGAPEARVRGAVPASASSIPVVPGVGAYKHVTAEQTVRQMGMCRTGFAVFSYSSLYVSPDEARKENGRLCLQRREAVRRHLSR